MNWVGVLLLVIHLIACSGVILIVLLQAGRGASLGAAFGAGASQTVFGARSATFMTRLTWVLAGAFMATSLLLTMVSPWGGTTMEGAPPVLEEEPVPLGQGTSEPATLPTETGQPTLPGMSPGAETIPQAPSETPEEWPAQPGAPLETPMQPEEPPAQP